MQSRFDGHLNAFGGAIERIERWLRCSYGHVNFLDKLLVCIDFHFGFAQSVGIDSFERSLSTGDCVFASHKLHLEPIQQGLRPNWSNSCSGCMPCKLQLIKHCPAVYNIIYIYIKLMGIYVVLLNITYKTMLGTIVVQNKQTRLVYKSKWDTVSCCQPLSSPKPSTQSTW